jgi:hypothetical protein
MASSTNEKNQHAVEGKNKPVKSELKDLNSGTPHTSKATSKSFNGKGNREYSHSASSFSTRRQGS